MQVNMLKSKIHRATVVQSELDYVGSITVDEELMKQQEYMNMKKFKLQTLTMETDLKHTLLQVKKFRHDLFKWCSSAHGKLR